LGVLGRLLASFGEYASNPLPSKKVVNRQFQAKTPKYKNSNIPENINPTKTKFGDKADTNNCTSWDV